ncbi:MAG: hypothetical protein IKB02_02200 [Clostridia bacterium]|nr:hypothetical protein [Clostridia bacterium]
MKERSKKLIDIIFCIILLIFSLSLMFSLLFSKEKSFSEKENRVLKTRPSVKIDRILDGRFFSEFSKYCADQFPLREFFTGISSFIDLSLGRIEANGIIVINNKVLIPRNDYSNNQILHDNLKAIATFIESNKSNGLPSYIVVAPRSLDVNKEKLPICFSNDYGTAEYDALYNTIKKQNLIDTLPCLTKNVKEKNFYNTDHHWTTHGAYIAYLEITNRLGIEPYPIDFFNVDIVSTDFLGTSFSRSGLYSFDDKDTIVLYRYKNDDKIIITRNGKERPLYDFSALEHSDKYRIFLGGNTDILEIRNQEAKPKLLIIKDSFANSVIPFLTLHFDIDVIDLRYYKNSLSSYISSNDFEAVLLLFGIDTLATETSCINIRK